MMNFIIEFINLVSLVNLLWSACLQRSVFVWKTLRKSIILFVVSLRLLFVFWGNKATVIRQLISYGTINTRDGSSSIWYGYYRSTDSKHYIFVSIYSFIQVQSIVEKKTRKMEKPNEYLNAFKWQNHWWTQSEKSRLSVKHENAIQHQHRIFPVVKSVVSFWLKKHRQPSEMKSHSL